MAEHMSSVRRVAPWRRSATVPNSCFLDTSDTDVVQQSGQTKQALSGLVIKELT